MKQYCEYCGGVIQDIDEKCPNCGGTNANHKRTVSDTPKTIQELKEWYIARGLPDENITRFFIEKDIKEPKAFGIYEKFPGYFVVYKNKASGERTVRYEGTDEAYAISELYLKLKSEILNQKNRNVGNKKKKNNKTITYLGMLFVYLVIIALSTVSQFAAKLIAIVFTAFLLNSLDNSLIMSSDSDWDSGGTDWDSDW